MWEGNINQLPPAGTHTGDWTHNPGMCPDQESTNDILLCGTRPNQLSHTGQGPFDLCPSNACGFQFLHIRANACFSLFFVITILVGMGRGPQHSKSSLRSDPFTRSSFHNCPLYVLGLAECATSYKACSWTFLWQILYIRTDSGISPLLHVGGSIENSVLIC